MTTSVSTPLQPPRLTGDPQLDYAALVEYLWSFYRAVLSTYVPKTDVGSQIQPTTAMLQALAPLVPAADKLPYTISSSTAALATLTAFARTILDDVDAAATRTTLGLGALAVINLVGTSQLSDKAVTYGKIQDVSNTDKMLGRASAGAGVIEEVTVTAAGRAILDDADASAQRTTLGLGTASVLTGSFGTYAPTLTNVANLDASTTRQATWMRIGNTVTVAGQVDVDPTLAATVTTLGISLPVASALTTAYQLGGAAFALGIAGQGAGVQGDAANDRASMTWVSGDMTNQTMCYTFSYEVL